MVTLSSLFKNLKQRRLQFMQVLNHEICKQRAIKTIITFKMGYNHDHLDSLCTFVAHTCAISGESDKIASFEHFLLENALPSGARELPSKHH
jgi:hypothetical protein